jgi:hypothetical protein
MYKLNQIAEKYNFKISTKTEVMTFKGKDPARSKIVINGNILKQVSNSNDLGCNLSCNYDGYVQTKLARFQVMCGMIRRILGKQTRKATQLKSERPWQFHPFYMGVKAGLDIEAQR